MDTLDAALVERIVWSLDAHARVALVVACPTVSIVDAVRHAAYVDALAHGRRVMSELRSYRATGDGERCSTIETRVHGICARWHSHVSEDGRGGYWAFCTSAGFLMTLHHEEGGGVFLETKPEFDSVAGREDVEGRVFAALRDAVRDEYAV